MDSNIKNPGYSTKSYNFSTNECKNCGCEYDTSEKDIQFYFILNAFGNLRDGEYYIICPECQFNVNIKIKYHIVKDRIKKDTKFITIDCRHCNKISEKQDINNNLILEITPNSHKKYYLKCVRCEGLNKIPKNDYFDLDSIETTTIQVKENKFCIIL